MNKLLVLIKLEISLCFFVVLLLVFFFVFFFGNVENPESELKLNTAQNIQNNSISLHIITAWQHFPHIVAVQKSNFRSNKLFIPSWRKKRPIVMLMNLSERRKIFDSFVEIEEKKQKKK